MRLLRTILLGLLALLAITAAVFQTRDGSLARLFGRASFKEGENLFSFKPAKADLILVRNGDKSVTFFKNDKGIWREEGARGDRMDPRAAEAILQFAIGTKVVDMLPMTDTVKGNMREFGVENAPVEVIIKDKKEHSLARFKLGNIAPWILPPEKEKETDPIPTIYLKTDYYQWLNNIFVVSGNIMPLFKDGFRYLRDHRPLYINPADLKQIDIKTDSDNLTLKRESDKAPWLITKPIPLESDPALVNNLIGVLQQLTALKVNNPEEITVLEKNSPLNKQITLSFLNGQPPVTLTIYPKEKPDSQTVLATVSDRNCLFTLPVKAIAGLPGIQNLALSTKLLRSKILVNLDRLLLDGISIRSDADMSAIILHKFPAKKQWLYSVDRGPFRPVYEEQLGNLLKTLIYDPVADFATDSAVDLEPYGLYSPLYTLTFSFMPAPVGEEGKNTTGLLLPPVKKDPISIAIGRGIDGKYYAMVDDLPTVYTLSPDYLDRLGLHSYRWKPVELLQINNSELKAINISTPEFPSLKIEYDFAGDAWTVTENGQNVTPSINPNKANHYLDELAKTRVLQWLPSTNASAREALKHPTHTITLVSEPSLPVPGIPYLTETLFIAPVGQGNNSLLYYGQKEGESEYFIMNKAQLDLLIPDLKDTGEDDR